MERHCKGICSVLGTVLRILTHINSFNYHNEAAIILILQKRQPRQREAEPLVPRSQREPAAEQNRPSGHLTPDPMLFPAAPRHLHVTLNSNPQKDLVGTIHVPIQQTGKLKPRLRAGVCTVLALACTLSHHTLPPLLVLPNCAHRPGYHVCILLQARDPAPPPSF